MDKKEIINLYAKIKGKKYDVEYYKKQHQKHKEKRNKARIEYHKLHEEAEHKKINKRKRLKTLEKSGAIILIQGII